MKSLGKCIKMAFEVMKINDNEVYIKEGETVLAYATCSSDSPMSNFYFVQREFEYKNKKWITSEQAIMWSKAKLFEDEISAIAIETSECPCEAKFLGRLVRNYDEKRWREWCDKNVPLILKAKFEQDPVAKEWLLSTQQAALAEMAKEETIDGISRVVRADKLWGIEIGITHPEIADYKNWSLHGQNLLGKYVMQARAMIK